MAGKKWKINQVMALINTDVPSPVSYRALVLLLLMLFINSIVIAGEANIPHVGKKALDNWPYYQQADEHKAFAIAPGGAWAWQAGALSAAEAEQTALENCQSHTQQRCVLYALNNNIVFDAEAWPTLWSPYADNIQAQQAATGRLVGQRFYDIRWQSGDEEMSVSKMRGKLVFLHFWGSWCPPCLREFPELQRFHVAVGEKFGDRVEMVLLQVREPFIISQQWANDNGFTDLPLADSGVDEDGAGQLMLTDGSLIKDREIARVFPSTYILDKHGLVLFSHYGPVSNWNDYLSFIEHVVNNQQTPQTDLQVN